jgi:hypothetical protein
MKPPKETKILMRKECMVRVGTGELTTGSMHFYFSGLGMYCFSI